MDEPNKPITPYVLITPKGDGFALSWAFTTFSQEIEPGKFACFIPAFDLYFSAKDLESMEKKSRIITNLFFDHYVLHSGKNGLKNITLQLHKLGFKAANDISTIHQLVNNRVIKAKFKRPNVQPSGEFSNAKQLTQELTMDVAV